MDPARDLPQVGERIANPVPMADNLDRRSSMSEGMLDSATAAYWRRSSCSSKRPSSARRTSDLLTSPWSSVRPAPATAAAPSLAKLPRKRHTARAIVAAVVSSLRYR
jgi:hypothetical protein